MSQNICQTLSAAQQARYVQSSTIDSRGWEIYLVSLLLMILHMHSSEGASRRGAAESMNFVILNQIIKNNNVSLWSYSFKNIRFVYCRMINKSSTPSPLRICQLEGLARALPTISFEDLLIKHLCVFIFLQCSRRPWSLQEREPCPAL